MKIIRFIFLSLLALVLIACAGVFILFQTFDADQYLPQIARKASLILGRPVDIAHVGLGFSLRGITLDAGPLTVADDPAFTTQPFIKVDRVRISLDLRSLILQREIHIKGIILQSPQIHFIRSQEGNINASTIGQANRSTGDDDNRGQLPILLEVKNKNNRELTPIIKKNGKMSPIISKKLGLLWIQDASISYIDQNKTMPLDIWLSDINASLTNVSLSKPFQLSLYASLYSDAPNVHVKALVSLDLSKRSVQISDLMFHADLPHLGPDQSQSISPAVPDSPILKDMVQAVQLNLAHLQVSTSGDLAANGDITVTGGVIKNFNIIKTVLSHALGNFEGIDSSIDNLLNGQLKGTLGADDTVIKKAMAQFSFHDKSLFIDDSLVQTNIFELTAKGSVDQGLNTDMQTMLHLNADVSAALVSELDGLKYLMDDSKRIAIGAGLKGIIPHLKYKPDKDFRKKGKKFLIEEGGGILGVLFGSGQKSEQGQDASSEGAGKKTKIKFKNILNSFL